MKRARIDPGGCAIVQEHTPGHVRNTSLYDEISRICVAQAKKFADASNPLLEPTALNTGAQDSAHSTETTLLNCICSILDASSGHGN